MRPFLKQVAEHYFSEGEISRLCFVFPNRRASAFFKKYLSECVARSGKVLMAPKLFTMNDFFYDLAGAAPTDQVHLLVKLFHCYSELNKEHESLDDFIFWGSVLLSDFDDVDKYLADPVTLFSNIYDLKSIQDTFTYLSAKQLAAIGQFVSHFRTGGEYKGRFRKIWDILYPLYRDFNASLKADGMSYEGAVYRSLAERLADEPAVDLVSKKFPNVVRFVFIGLNAPNKCELRLMSKLRDAGLAQFCWDFSSDMLKDDKNMASFFMKDYVRDFPQAFSLDDEGLPKTEFSVLSVSSVIGQAKQLPAIFDRLGATGIETAVVLPDESQLLPVLNSIPSGISDINVTMGYPMDGSELWTFMNDIAALQMHIRSKEGRYYFYCRQVFAIFSNSIFKTIAGEAGMELAASIQAAGRYYIPETAFHGDPVCELIFRPIVKDGSQADARTIADLEKFQKSVLLMLASHIRGNAEMAVELDFCREYYLAVGRLEDCELPLLPATYFHLLSNLVGKASVPFRGEPLKGLQIMGPLETRALDFDNVIILNCNEGIFPRRNVSSSFIPPELRKGYDLPTYEHQDAVWAYYFYRLVQRASHVWMLFDSRTEGVKTGEESRYVKQLELYYGVDVRRYVAKSPVGRREDEGAIPKTQADIETLHGRRLSATGLQAYLNCPAKFYYASVLGLKAPDDISESLDAGMLGTLFHKSMEKLYRQAGDYLTVAFLKSVAASDIKSVVRTNLMEILKTFEVSGRNIIFEDMVCRWVERVIDKDIKLLADSGKDRFKIYGLEQRRGVEIGGYTFVGSIDRLDSLREGEVRIVDYKTGKVTDDDFIITDANAEEVVAKLFGDKSKDRPKIALQLFLYDIYVKNDPEMADSRVLNSVYQTSRLFVKDVEEVELSPKFCDLMTEGVGRVLEEISDTGTPWKRTEDADECKLCDFKMICGR